MKLPRHVLLMSLYNTKSKASP